MIVMYTRAYGFSFEQIMLDTAIFNRLVYFSKGWGDSKTIKLQKNNP